MSDVGRDCVLDTCRFQTREANGYEVACVASDDHVCLVKPYVMFSDPNPDFVQLRKRSAVSP